MTASRAGAIITTLAELALAPPSAPRPWALKASIPQGPYLLKARWLSDGAFAINALSLGDIVCKAVCSGGSIHPILLEIKQLG